MEGDIYYQEVEVKPKRPRWPWFNTVFLVLAIVALGYYHLELDRQKDRAQYWRSRAKEADRYVAYASRFIALKNDMGKITKDWANECFRVPASQFDKKLCDKLDYKIERYNREFDKINKVYEEGGWVKDPNAPEKTEEPYVYLETEDGGIRVLRRDEID